MAGGDQNGVHQAPARRLSSPRLVGRERELDLLVSVASQPPSVVAVEGEAGVGKSRLVEEFRREVSARLPVRLGRCHPGRHPFPLEPWVDALSQLKSQLRMADLGPLAGRLRPLLPELSDLLPPEPRPDEGPLAQSHQLFRAFRELLSALGPCVVVLEDLQWADDTTAELLHFLAAAPPPDLSLVLTYRSEDLSPGSSLHSLRSRLGPEVSHAQISLAPLSPEGVGELVGAILGGEGVSSEFAQFLHSRTAGIPFGVEEVLALLEDRHDLVPGDGGWRRRHLERIEVPTAIRAAIVERLAHLSVAARWVVSALAVAGEPLPEEAVGEVTELEADQVVDALGEALEAGLLFEGSAGLSFRHELARQAVYEAVSAPHRRRMHLRLAERMASDRSCPAARVAHHFREAGRSGEWAEFAERAADQAVARFDEAGACRILEQLLREGSLERAERVRLAEKLGQAALDSLVPGDSAQLLRRVLDQDSALLPPEVAAHLRFLLGAVLARAGEASAARAEITRAVAGLAIPAVQVTAMATLAYPADAEGSLADYERWMEKATHAARCGGGPDILVEEFRTTYQILLGDPAGWEAVDARPPPRPNTQARRTHARWVANLAKCAVLVGHYTKASELAAAATRACEEFSFVEPLPGVRATEVLCGWWTGRWQGLASRAQELLADPMDTPHHRPMAALALHCYGMATEDPGAEQGLRQTAELAMSRGLFPVSVAATGALAAHQVELWPQVALELALPAVEALRTKGIWAWGAEVIPAAVAALVGLGRVEEADELADELAHGLVGRDAPAAQAALPLCRGLVAEGRGHKEDALARFAEAGAAWAGLPRPYDAALATERLGRALIDLDAERAVSQLRAALAQLEDLEASRDAARVRQVLRGHGVATPGRRGRRSYGDALSPREEEVLRLAQSGHTYRQIAERLHLSPRTVQSHLVRARRKQR